MDQKRLVKTSKYLSKHLRHQPERLGLTLADGGWVEVEELLAACARNGLPLTRAELEEVVARNDKRRFGFSEDGSRIRASQGHSVAVDLQLAPAAPPPVLFHGTHPGVVDAIMREGLRPQARHHVHLSADVETATRVGARRGRPVVLEVAAAAMAADGVEFFVSDNGVWLCAAVPPLPSPRRCLTVSAATSPARWASPRRAATTTRASCCRRWRGWWSRSTRGR